jgi:hypothetical protein
MAERSSNGSEIHFLTWENGIPLSMETLQVSVHAAWLRVRLVLGSVLGLRLMMETMMSSQSFAVLGRVKLVQVRGLGLDLKLNVTMHLRRRCTRRNQQTFRCLHPRMKEMDLLMNTSLHLTLHLR